MTLTIHIKTGPRSWASFQHHGELSLLRPAGSRFIVACGSPQSGRRRTSTPSFGSLFHHGGNVPRKGAGMFSSEKASEWEGGAISDLGRVLYYFPMLLNCLAIQFSFVLLQISWDAAFGKLKGILRRVICWIGRKSWSQTEAWKVILKWENQVYILLMPTVPNCLWEAGLAFSQVVKCFASHSVFSLLRLLDLLLTGWFMCLQIEALQEVLEKLKSKRLPHYEKKYGQVPMVSVFWFQVRKIIFKTAHSPEQN